MPRTGRQRIGLLGGSFNPAHEGHLYISREALKRLNLDAVWWLVSPQNPLKSTTDMASLPARLAQARAVAAGDPRIRVSAIEAALGTRYSVDTLTRLTRRYPAARFVWLIGADNLAQLPRWRNWTRMLELAPIAVFARESYDSKALTGVVAQRYRAARLPQSAAGLLADLELPAWTYIVLRRHPAAATDLRRSGQWPPATKSA